MLRVLTSFILLLTVAMLLACGSAPASAPESALPAQTPVPTATRAPTATPTPTTLVSTPTLKPTEPPTLNLADWTPAGTVVGIHKATPVPTLTSTATASSALTPAPMDTTTQAHSQAPRPTSPISSGGNGRYPATVGAQAPTFTLPSGNGPVVDLASYAGKKDVVLVFYRTHT